jgi:AraC-like DNA-binding protein
MRAAIKHYSDINEMFRNIRLPEMRHPLFYITKFEQHKFDKTKSSIYTHDYFEIAFSFGYDVNVSVGEQTSNALSHSLIFISPGQMVKWEGSNDWVGQAMGYLLLFKPEFLSFSKDAFQLYKEFPYLNRNTMPSYRLSEENKLYLQSFFDKMNQEYKRFDENSIEIIRSYLTIFLFEAKRILNITSAKSSLKSRADEITYLFENRVMQTAFKRQPIKYYAAQLNISPVYLSECIKKTTGKTAKQVIDEYLILEIKSLLKHSHESIAQIASNLGFDDHSNFVKYFKKHTELSPKMFKEKHNF